MCSVSGFHENGEKQDLTDEFVPRVQRKKKLKSRKTFHIMSNGRVNFIGLKCKAEVNRSFLHLQS